VSSRLFEKCSFFLVFRAEVECANPQIQALTTLVAVSNLYTGTITCTLPAGLGGANDLILRFAGVPYVLHNAFRFGRAHPLKS
jgi:hypothetical protein